ncbi:MAG: amidophosphoribosyltransferase [Candidatus Omnitrophica bacterium]|nr:amidophosphoribosyltransferase [Candidatus Omnitrophota bacterium]
MSGLFGVVSKKGDCVSTLFYGTDYHSHLGTEFGGIAVLGDDFTRQIHNISQSQFKSKFYEEYKHIKGDKGIGVISSLDEQPIYVHSKFGPFCIATEGLVENAGELAEDLLKAGVSFSEVGRKGAINTTELIAKLINQGDDLTDGIQKMFSVIQGSCSLLILTHDGIYAARDRFGYTGLTIGERPDAFSVTSETCAFPNNRFEIKKALGPGEIVLLNKKGIKQIVAPSKNEQICTFLWIYTGFPASSYEGVNVEVVREKSGRFLAKRDHDIEIDMACGVPDSGTAHALGYAMECGKPYRRALVKYTPGYGRSYTPPSQETRDLVATMKLIPIREIIEGARLVLCEDSIVRGTQLKNYTVKKLWEAGAKEIHVRPACPPLMFPCRFCLSTRSIDELAARRAIRDLEGEDIEDVSDYTDHTTQKYQEMVEWIRKDIEVTTLRYQTIDDMVKAVGLPREKLCLYCWTGECPSFCSTQGSKCAEALQAAT